MQLEKVKTEPYYALHPDRFVHGAPASQTLPAEVWINPPRQRRRLDTTNPDKIVHGEASLPQVRFGCG